MNIKEALNPPLALLVKLGSIVVHADEYMSEKGHELDKIAIETLLRDPDVTEWISVMTSAAMLPVKR